MLNVSTIAWIPEEFFQNRTPADLIIRYELLIRSNNHKILFIFYFIFFMFFIFRILLKLFSFPFQKSMIPANESSQ